MRNQYKVLSEKYDLIREQETVTPSASLEGREIKGVFVPAEIEQWTDNVLRFPIRIKGSYKRVIGYRKTDQNYTPGELKVIVNHIYNQWKDQPLEEIQQAIKPPAGSIYQTLLSAKKYEKLTPEQLQARKDRDALNKQLKRTNTKQAFNTSTGQVQEQVLKIVIADNVLANAAARAREKNLPFFYNLDSFINQPRKIYRANRQKAVDYIYSIWPPDNRCPATGMPFLLGTKFKEPNSPSLDKLIPDKGYVIGNVAVISELANRIKNEGNLEQIKKVYNYSKEGNQILSRIKNHLNGFEGEIDNPVINREGGTRLPRTLSGAVVRTNEYKLPPIDIDLKYLKNLFPIKSAMVCPVLGIPLFWSNIKTNNTPSLDRINPKLGYVKGNVVFISDLANSIKNDATTEQIEGVLNWMKKVGAWPDPD